MNTTNHINDKSNTISDHDTSETEEGRSNIPLQLVQPTFFSTLKEYIYTLYVKYISPYIIRLPFITVNGSDMECMSSNVLDYHINSNDVEVAHSAPTSSPSLLANGLFCRPGTFSKASFSDSIIQPIKARSRSESEGLNKYGLIRLSQNSFLDEIEVKKSCHRFPFNNMDNCDCNDESDSAASSGISSSEEQSLSDFDYGTPPDFNHTITENEIISKLKELDNSSSSSSIATILAQNSNTSCSSPSQETSPPSDKKCVKFADELGKELYTIRVMKEPSDYPPRLSPSILRRYRNNNDDSDEFYDSDNSDNEKSKASWTLDFKQPASEYVKFRESLDTNKVALENVVLKNNCHKMTGTIKVVNLSYEKKVFLRLTTDKWKTYKDIYGKYQPSNSKIYDTFCFETEIPKDEKKDDTIEFCICYEADNQQYWDSKNGNNYHLVTEEKIDSSEDAYNMKQMNWTHFAAWKNLTNERPYCIFNI
uniref:CBM21 domain-containing protein n=1 Tax=Strongyloides stercoralis TaxID=6248 RepID=A0A0K0DZV5_STRER